MQDQRNRHKGLPPELQRILTGEYRRESEESFRRMREAREDAERHLEKLGRIIEEMKR
jgi:hypothetical protein